MFPLLVLLVLPTLAHASSGHGGTGAVEGEPSTLGAQDFGVVRVEATAMLGDPVEVTFRVQRRLDPPDPMLGAFAPLAGATVTVTLSGGPKELGPIDAHGEGEAGMYGVHFAGLAPGPYTVNVMVMAPDAPMASVSFPLTVPKPSGTPMDHHTMSHPFLTHMGIPDGPGESSVRVAYIQRANGATTGQDVAFHVEAGILPRLGLHLRNDAITSDGSSESGHGTELMLMYALAQDKDATRGISVFGEVAVPTPQGAGSTISGALGVSARYLWRTRLLFDAVVHVDPMEGFDELGLEYEVSAQVRVAGRVSLIVEDSGELGSMEMTNYLLPAIKVGLGETGGTIGAGAQFALMADRAFDRQAMFQLDWAF